MCEELREWASGTGALLLLLLLLLLLHGYWLMTLAARLLGVEMQHPGVEKT